ncbi:MAG TPA: O-antigen ligase family protein [Gemmataceae bacterium]|nr:O-antigen ligase family protein [Gemmataceae bacterium]
MEVIVLSLVCLSPWAFGGVEPYQGLLYAGVAVLLVLWALRMLAAGKLTWRKCPVILCLTGLVVLGLWQIAPLSEEVVRRYSQTYAELRAQLLPAETEVLPSEDGLAGPAPRVSGPTLSLNPGGTWNQILQLLAVLALFAVVRNNLPAEAGLRRLSVVAVANGTLLALFALVQFFTSPSHRLYWRFDSEGAVFGPFICRNHFPFYLNLCIGLGLGLLLAFRAGGVEAGLPDRGRRRHFQSRRGRSRPPGAGGGSFLLGGWLEDPRALWLGAALALMISSVLCSLSRGGFLALLGAAAVCLAVKLTLAPRFRRPGVLLLALTAAGALAVWFGLDRIQARLGTLWEGGALDHRLPMWINTLPLFLKAPYVGSGYGTFVLVEPLTRDGPAFGNLVFDHAHNDYLEALIEGGLFRLLVSLLAIGLVLGFGYRAARRYRGRRAGGLALGALFAFTTVVIHSVGDFGLHIPAVAILTTVIAAYLCSLGSSPLSRTEAGTSAEPDTGQYVQYVMRLGGVGPVLGAGVACALAGLLFFGGWQNSRAERLRIEAAALAVEPSPENQRLRLEKLRQAAELAPNSAAVQLALARAHLDDFEAAVARREERDLLGNTLGSAALPALPGTGSPPVLGPAAEAASVLAAAAVRQQHDGGEAEQLRRDHLIPALGHYLRARDLCPLLAEPHEKLGEYAHYLTRAEPRFVYLARAARLCPHDARLWYLCGRELLEDDPDLACKNWRRSLELSDQYLDDILALSAGRLDPDQILEEVLPDRPDVLVTAAVRLYPDPEDEEKRRPLLERALAAQEQQPARLKARDLHLRGSICAALGQEEEAVTAYREALALEPLQVEWRFELAGLLHQQGRLQEARRELITLLQRQPKNWKARKLLEAVAREIAMGK